MPPSSRILAVLAAALVVLATAGAALPATAQAGAQTAALQVALKAVGLYGGPIDGVAGRGTKRAVRRFQRRKGLKADGVAGPRTKRALGRRGRPRTGSRTMKRGQRGWDVAALQWHLRRRGCRPGGIDGGFGPGTAAAVRRCQRRYGLTADGLAGRGTLRALAHRRAPRPKRRRLSPRRGSSGTPLGPVRFLRPVGGPLSSPFGRRWGRPHQGVDYAAPTGTPVTAAGVGTVTGTGFIAGYGNVVRIQHRLGWETLYAHLSAILARPGQAVGGGVVIGRVGSTGNSTGPHLHFETRLNGVPQDPALRLLG